MTNMSLHTTAYEVDPAKSSRLSYTDTPFGKARRVTVQTFLDTYAPPLSPEVDIEKLMNTRSIVGKNGRLWGYEKKRPSQMSRDYAFSYLSRCVSKLGESSACLWSHQSFQNNLEKKWDLKDAEVTAHADAYILLGPEEGVEKPPRKTRAIRSTRSSPRLPRRRNTTALHQRKRRSHQPQQEEKLDVPVVPWASIAVSGVYSQSSSGCEPEVVSITFSSFSS